MPSLAQLGLQLKPVAMLGTRSMSVLTTLHCRRQSAFSQLLYLADNISNTGVVLSAA